MYIVTSALPGGMTYIFQTKKERDEMKAELMRRFPLITFYTGETNKFGMVTYDLPKFPK